MGKTNLPAAWAQPGRTAVHETNTSQGRAASGETLSICWKAGGAEVMRCASCGSAYLAPEGNYICPLCASDCVAPSGESPESFGFHEDVTDSLLYAFLTSSAALAR